MVWAALLMLLFAVTPSVGQLSDYWGVRFGTTIVTQDNYPQYTDEKTARFGWLLGVSRTLPIADWKSIRLVLEGQARHSSWNRFIFEPGQREYDDPHVQVHEFVFSPLFIHSVSVDKARFFLQAGPEISYVNLTFGTFNYDDTHWRDVGFSINLGGGIIIPAGHDKEFVLDIRYNSDISKAVDDTGRHAPVGSRFDELHILLGVNLTLDEGY